MNAFHAEYLVINIQKDFLTLLKIKTKLINAINANVVKANIFSQITM